MAENTYRISLQGVEVSYPKHGNRRAGRTVILNNIGLHIRAGEFLALVGPTGCGKSTLLRLSLGAQCPTRARKRFLTPFLPQDADRHRSEVPVV